MKQQKEIDLNKIVEQAGLSAPLPLEVSLNTLRLLKRATAVAGAFSPTKVGFGLLFNSVPRTQRANEAKNARDLFKAARNVKNGTADEKDNTRLHNFLNLVTNRAETTMVERAENTILNTREALNAQLEYNQQVTGMTVEQLATILTAISIVQPSGLDTRAVLGKYAPLQPSYKKATTIVDRDMVSGWTKQTNIDNIERYIADKIAQVHCPYFDKENEPATKHSVAVNAIAVELDAKEEAEKLQKNCDDIKTTFGHTK